MPARLRFDRHEWAGMFGDLGTDLPLLVGMIAACRLDAPSVLILFGVMQILTGLRYRLPMPVQPLKAVAALVIATPRSPEVIAGAGLAIGAVMLLLTVTGGLEGLARLIPKCVVRGMQLGLALKLGEVALADFVAAEGTPGYVLAAVLFVVAIALRGRGKVPAALVIVGLGLGFAGVVHGPELVGALTPRFALPTPVALSPDAVWTGFLLLALPQIPLSIGNSILATRQVVEDLFPDRPVKLRQIGLTYSLMNLVAPWLGGVPTCHGSGGIVGHYTFGARTGGSVILYGALFVLLGLFGGHGFEQLTVVFPLPALGVLLLFEALGLVLLVRDQAGERRDWAICALVGLAAASLPYGFVVGLVAGTALAWSPWDRTPPADTPDA